MSLPNPFFSFPSPVRNSYFQMSGVLFLANFGKLHAVCAFRRYFVQFIHLSFASGKQNLCRSDPWYYCVCKILNIPLLYFKMFKRFPLMVPNLCVQRGMHLIMPWSAKALFQKQHYYCSEQGYHFWLC